MALQSSSVQTFLTQRLAGRLSEMTGTKITVGKVNIAFFKKVLIKDILVEDSQADTLMFVKSVFAKIDTLSFRKQKVAIGSLEINETSFFASRDSLNRFNFSDIIDKFKEREKKPEPVSTQKEWKISCNTFNFSGSEIFFDDSFGKDPQSVKIKNFGFVVNDFFLQNDSVRLILEQFTLNDGKDFKIDEFSSEFNFAGNRIKVNELNLKTLYSSVEGSSLLVNLPDSSDNFFEDVRFDFNFSHCRVSLFDLALLLPDLKGMNQIIDCSGQISGTVNDLRGKNIELSTGKNTYVLMDFYLNDITNSETMYLFLDLKQSQTTFSELSKIRLPDKGKKGYLSFPKDLYEAGLVSYQGNFSGFLTDFVAYGTLNSEMGIITTDLSVKPRHRRSVSYRGKVETDDFRLGDFIKNEHLGNISLSSTVDGAYHYSARSASGKFEGTVSKVEINSYVYENIRLDGILDSKMFDGLVVMNDSNLQFDFLGKVDFNPEIPVFNFRLDLKKALLDNLNLITKYPESELSFLMNANFSGNRIDNLAGMIKAENGEYKNLNGKLDFGGIELKSIASGLNNYLTFSSEFFDLEINGSFYAQSISDALEKSMYKYIPIVGYNPQQHAKANKFGFQIDVKSLDNLTEVFLPKIKIETPFLLYGQMDSDNSVFELKGSIPGFQTKNIMFRNIFIGNNPRDEMYVSRFRFGEILLKNGMKVDNLTINSEIAENIVVNQVTWGEEGRQNYSGHLLSRMIINKDDEKGIFADIEGFPSQIFLGDSLLQINPFIVNIDSSRIKINNFKLLGSGQQIVLDGEIAKNDSARMMILFDNIKLGLLGPYAEREIPVKGVLNGMADITDFYGERLLNSDIAIEGFSFREQNIGHLSLVNGWDNEEKELKSELKIINNNRQNLLAAGSYNPQTGDMKYDAVFDQVPLVVLETVIRNNLSNFHGNGTGKMKIHGNPEKIKMDGAIYGLNAGLTVDFTQVSYNFSDSVYFKTDTILFDRISIHDLAGNRGTFEGTIVHNNFKDMRYNLSVKSPRLIAMNTSARHNSRFFGQVITNGSFHISGMERNVKLSGAGTTLLGTNVNISLEDESELQRFDFIQFVSTEDTVKQKFLFPKKDDGNFSLDLTVNATPEARAQLIYNAQIGDVIRAQGEGLLRFGINKDGDITLSGTYEVERGDYLFTLQNVINKRFSIEQGGSITWSGDPYNAIIDLKAVYKLKASLYDLLVDTYANIYQSQRIPVECKIILNEELSNPNIDFAIDFPSVEDRLTEVVKQHFSTSEEMNKQILSLVVLGKFYTPEYLRGTYEAQNPNLIGTTASELFSNQLSNWLSQISNNVDIGLNYRPGSQITNDEIELALSTQMFNDRVTINGNIGNNVNPYSTNNSQLVGDFDINVKLIPNGKIRFKAYNRSNNNLVYETAPYTQGVGFTFTEDFNTFNDLLAKMKAIFGKKEKN